MRIANWTMVVMLVACSGGTRATSTPTPASQPGKPVPAKPTPPDDPYAALNLGFEQVEARKPRGWSDGIGAADTQAGTQERVLVDDVVHGGARAFRFTVTDKETFASSATTIDAAPLRGKRLRLHGWIRTEKVDAGFAGVWVRVDGGATMAFDNMGSHGVTGTRDWTEGVAEVMVPTDGVTVVLGALLVGVGTAWFDDLSIEVIDVPPPHPIAIDGTVVDPTGAPVDGAEVALIVRGTPKLVQHVASDAAGRFHFDAMTGSAWGISAVHAGATAGFVDAVEYDADAAVTVTLGDGGVTVRGTLTGDPLPAGTFVQISTVSPHDSDLFAVAVETDGSFEAILPRGDVYNLVGLDRVVATGSAKRAGDVAEITAEATLLGPPPEEVVAWIAKHGAPLISAEAGHGFDDMAPIGKMVGKAHVVGLGEATHGTREFFQLKHRFLEYLVAEKGFTVFAIEANQPECRAVNDYVLNGTGDARTAIAGMYFWTWDTEEVLAMVEWMRAWNADESHHKKVQFTGFDMQFTPVAMKNLSAYLAEVAPDDAAGALAPLAPLATERAPVDVPKAAPADQDAMQAGIDALEKRFDEHAKAWRKATGKARFDDARHDLRVVEQALQMYRAGDDFSAAFAIRDASMAENIGWIRDHQPKRTRMVLWAHNGHVGFQLAALDNMGKHLHEKLGKEYVVFGFAFGQGSFQAIGPDGSLGEHTLGEAPEWDLSAPFTRAGHPILVLDLRALPKKGVVRDWFRKPHPMRDTGAGFFNEEAMSQPVRITRLFDALIFVDRTTRARPLPALTR